MTLSQAWPTAGMLGVYAVVTGAIGERVAEPDRAGSAFLVADGTGHQGALSRRGRLGDDVDHAIDGIGPPQRGAGSADHLDPVDVFQHRVLEFPEHAGKQRRV